MKLSIENIARVEQANITLKGITIVAGANGSGKSTISKSLYAMLEAFDNPVQKAFVQKHRSEMTFLQNWVDNNVFFNLVGNKEITQFIWRTYKDSQGNIELFIKKTIDYLNKNTPPKSFDKIYMEKKIDLLYRMYQDIEHKDIMYYVKYFLQVVLISVFQNQINCLKNIQQNTQQGMICYQQDTQEYYVKVVNNKVIDFDNKIYDTEGIRPIYITTSDLVESVGSYRRLYSAEKYGTISFANAQLTKLLMEEIKIQDMVAEQYHKLEEQKAIFEKIFHSVLEGEIYLENHQLVYHDNWCDANIELRNTASSMKPFLILKRLIDNGTFLRRSCFIIDEPETNLHPEWQLKLAHLLVLLNFKLEIKIYINSHSPYFVRAIEYYADQYQILEQCCFYTMQINDKTGMFFSEDVTQQLGIIYDKLAEPFNCIM